MNQPHDSMDDMAEFAHRCCTGNCRQGRDCPKRQGAPAESLGVRLLWFYDVVAWAVALVMLVGVFRG